MLGMGGWLGRRMRTQEVGHWVSEFAAALTKLPAEVINELGASSFKPTLLSWAAKFGVDTGSRRLLGYHVKPKDKSVLIYSRDALAKPLRELGVVLDAVRSGRFLPDADRSGRFRNDTQDVVLPVEVAATGLPDFEDLAAVPVTVAVAPDSGDPPVSPGPVQSGDAGHIDCEDSSSSSSSVSSTDSPDKPADEVVYVANLRAKMLHIEAGDGVLACGRPYPRSFSALCEMPEGLTACRRCFKSGQD